MIENTEKLFDGLSVEAINKLREFTRPGFGDDMVAPKNSEFHKIFAELEEKGILERTPNNDFGGLVSYYWAKDYDRYKFTEWQTRKSK